MPCFNEMFLSTTSFTLHNKQYRNLLHTKYTQPRCRHHKQHTCLPPLPCVPVPPFLAAWCVGGPWWLGAGPPGPWRSSTPSCTHCPHCFVVHKLGPTKYPKSLCKYIQITLASTITAWKVDSGYRWRKKSLSQSI